MEDEVTRDELIDILVDVVHRACVDESVIAVSHMFIEEYKRAFDVLEKLGKLKYDDSGRYWAQIDWTEH